MKNLSIHLGHFFYVSYLRCMGPLFLGVIRATSTRRSIRFCGAKAASFLSYFKTLSIGPVQGIEPATFRSTVNRSADWANPRSDQKTKNLNVK